jgi:hypothetical protein
MAWSRCPAGATPACVEGGGRSAPAAVTSDRQASGAVPPLTAAPPGAAGRATDSTTSVQTHQQESHLRKARVCSKPVVDARKSRARGHTHTEREKHTHTHTHTHGHTPVADARKSQALSLLRRAFPAKRTVAQEALIPCRAHTHHGMLSSLNGGGWSAHTQCSSASTTAPIGMHTAFVKT